MCPGVIRNKNGTFVINGALNNAASSKRPKRLNLDRSMHNGLDRKDPSDAFESTSWVDG